jgi:hypothetical protein
MKALKAVVIGMGLLILLGLALVVAAIVSRVSDDSEESAGEGAPREVALGVAPACKVAGLAEAEDLLALRLEGPAEADCPAVLLVDPANGAVQRVLRTAPLVQGEGSEAGAREKAPAEP